MSIPDEIQSKEEGHGGWESVCVAPPQQRPGTRVSAGLQAIAIGTMQMISLLAPLACLFRSELQERGLRSPPSVVW